MSYIIQTVIKSAQRCAHILHGAPTLAEVETWWTTAEGDLAPVRTPDDLEPCSHCERYARDQAGASAEELAAIPCDQCDAHGRLTPMFLSTDRDLSVRSGLRKSGVEVAVLTEETYADAAAVNAWWQSEEPDALTPEQP